MKIFFIVALILQFLIESGVGLMMAVSPQLAAPDAAISELYHLRNEGFIALSIAVATWMLWLQRKNLAVIGYATAFFAVYHTLVTAAGSWNATLGFDFTPMTLHVVLGVFFWILWLRHRALAF